MTRCLSSCLAIVLVVLLVPSRASAQQSINAYFGGFFPHGLDSRGSDDVLFRNADFLTFNTGDFHNITGGAGYLVGLGDFFDAGLGIGLYSGTAPAVYTDLVNANGSEIEQDLKLRIVPMTATIRVLPLGHHDAITPYFGAGVGIYNWHYTETGQFVDSAGNIFRDTFEGSDTSVGPVILAGLRVPIGNIGLGFEYRYQGGSGTLPPSEGFAGSKIDLGGHNVFFTFNVGF